MICFPQSSSGQHKPGLSGLSLGLARHLEVALFLLPLLLGLPVWSAGTNQEQAPFEFRVGLSKICFRNVKLNDALAAHRVFIENTGRRLGYIYKADSQVFDDLASFEAAIRKQPMLLTVVDAWQYLQMDIQRKMKPYFAIMENGKVGRKYLVLTRRDSGFNTPASLRGKDLVQSESANASLGKIWLDTLLLFERLGTQETFFNNVEVQAKSSSVILPVFFGKKSACLVDEPSFDVMKELNPQLGKMLQILAISDAFADVVVCLSEEGWLSENLKTDTIQAMKELPLDPVGQQICTLFKIDRMVPFQESQLDTVRKLRETHEKLRKEAKP